MTIVIIIIIIIIIIMTIVIIIIIMTIVIILNYRLYSHLTSNYRFKSAIACCSLQCAVACYAYKTPYLS